MSNIKIEALLFRGNEEGHTELAVQNGQVEPLLGLAKQKVNDLMPDDEELQDEVLAPEEGHDKWLLNYGDTSVFTDMVLRDIPTGSPELPTMILEIGGGQEARKYPAGTLQRPDLVIGNIDMSPEWGDKRKQCDLNRLQQGLEDESLQELMQHSRLGAVVISHVLKFLEPDAAKTILDTAIGKLEPGGKVVVLDMGVSSGSAQMMRKMLDKHASSGKSEENDDNPDLHDFMYRRILKAFKHLEQMGQQDGYRFSRFALGLAAPEKLAKKIRNRTINHVQIGEAISDEGVLVKHPVSDSNADDIHQVGKKTLFPMHTEALLVLEKIDQDKERVLRAKANQRQRELERKKKRQRKEKKKQKRK